MTRSAPPRTTLLTLADIVGVYGIKGWVKLRVQLDDPQILLSLSQLQLSGPEAAKVSVPRAVTIQALRPHGKGFICAPRRNRRPYSGRIAEGSKYSGAGD